MARWILVGSLIAFAQGCATHLDLPRFDDSESASAQQLLRFQRSSIGTAGEGAPLLPEDLRPGDIILTSMPSFTSAGIQLMTLAPVSHAAVYIGDRRVAEAVPSGVRVRGLDELLEEVSTVLAFRHPDLGPEEAQSIRAYVLEKVGTGFNYLGVALHVPFAVNRRLCELPLMPSFIRDACIRSIGAIYHVATSERRFFCSQLVTQAYRHAGLPMTAADSRLITPADILHMREGDVPSLRIHQELKFVGYLKYPRTSLAALAQ